MRKWVCLFLALGLANSTAAAQDDKVFSGPQPGEKLTVFKAKGIWGANEGKEFQAMKNAKGPVMLIFVHEVTRPAFQLLRPVDFYADKLKKDGLQTTFVWLTADKTKTENWLNFAKKSLRLRSPVAISLDGLEGPGNYGLNRKVTLTILVGQGSKVTDNFAIIQPNETDAPKVFAAMAKAVKKKAPTLAQIRKELGGKRRPKPKPKDGKIKFPPDLVSLMRSMIQKTNDAKTVKEIATKLEKWAGDDRKRRRFLAELSRRVIRAEYGTEAARAALKKFVK